MPAGFTFAANRIDSAPVARTCSTLAIPSAAAPATPPANTCLRLNVGLLMPAILP